MVSKQKLRNLLDIPIFEILKYEVIFWKARDKVNTNVSVKVIYNKMGYDFERVQ
jgi:hypothetical protein